MDKLFKRMRGREERFGWDWSVEGHHPETEYAQLKKEMVPLCDALKKVIVGDCTAVEILGREVLSQGPWQLGSLPASSFVRKTPESLLNRATRLKLWLFTQDILSKNLKDEARLQALCSGLYGVITPSIEAAIKSQGYAVDDVVDDFLNYDMRKTRQEITRAGLVHKRDIVLNRFPARPDFVHWIVGIGVTNRQPAKNVKFSRNGQMAPNNIRISSQRNLDARPETPFGQGQQEGLQVHSHTYRVRETKILVKADEPGHGGVKKLPISQNVTLTTSLVVSSNSHGSVNLRAKRKPLFLELRRQSHRRPGRNALCLRDKSRG